MSSELVSAAWLEMANSRPGRPSPPIDEEALVSDYLDGMTQKALRAKYRTSWQRMLDILTRHGARRAGGVPKRTVLQPERPEVFIARQIITEAIEDWQRGEYPNCAHGMEAEFAEMGMDSVRAELLRFFHSKRFLLWCLMGDLEPDAVLKHNKIERRNAKHDA